VTTFIGDHGLVAVFVLMAVAAVLPAASELTMVYGGALASGALAGQVMFAGHHFDAGLHAYLAVVLAGILGNLVGAAGGWAIGAYGGQPLLERYGRYLHVTSERIARAERWFGRYEGIAVPLGFVTPLVRSFVAIPAGMFEVPFRRFFASALPGIATFCFAAAGIGWALGASWHAARGELDYVDVAVAVVVVAVVAWFVIRSRRSISMRGGASDTAR
jgi:membrane protein DedA with SNARE-associated domain